MAAGVHSCYCNQYTWELNMLFIHKCLILFIWAIDVFFPVISNMSVYSLLTFKSKQGIRIHSLAAHLIHYLFLSSKQIVTWKTLFSLMLKLPIHDSPQWRLNDWNCFIVHSICTGKTENNRKQCHSLAVSGHIWTTENRGSLKLHTSMLLALRLRQSNSWVFFWGYNRTRGCDINMY